MNVYTRFYQNLPSSLFSVALILCCFITREVIVIFNKVFNRNQVFRLGWFITVVRLLVVVDGHQTTFLINNLTNKHKDIV